MRFSELLSRGLKKWLSGFATPDPHAIAREARRRAEVALPTGERLSDSHVVAIGEGVPTPPAHLRPDLFPEARSTSEVWLDRAEKAERVLYRLNPVNAAVEAFDNRNGNREPAMSGGWDTAAGQLAAVLQPRTGSHAVSVLLLGACGLHLVHVQKSPDGLEVGPGVQHGWSVPLSRVAWFRKRDNVRHGTHVVGFDDGSWVSVHFPVAGWGTLVDALANPGRHAGR